MKWKKKTKLQFGFLFCFAHLHGHFMCGQQWVWYSRVRPLSVLAMSLAGPLQISSCPTGDSQAPSAGGANSWSLPATARNWALGDCDKASHSWEVGPTNLQDMPFMQIGMQIQQSSRGSLATCSIRFRAFGHVLQGAVGIFEARVTIRKYNV